MNNDHDDLDAKYWKDAHRRKAAQLVAEGELTDEEIAAACKRGRTWLHNQKQDVRFIARVKFLVEQLQAAVAGRGIVERRNRVDALNQRADDLRARQKLLRTVVAERAEHAERLLAKRRGIWEAMSEEERRQSSIQFDVPGATTGTLARGVKAVGHSVRETWELDAALLAELRAIDAELRATEKQAAQELGQWTEKRELTGKRGGPIRLRWDDGSEA